MKKLILGVLLAVGFVWSGTCDEYIENENKLADYMPPLHTGQYKFTSKHNTFKDGSLIIIGDHIQRSGWDVPSLEIDCKVKNIEEKYELGRGECYIFTIDCTVENTTQFIENIKWHTKAGYRKDGTRRWGRNKSGSTDIECYDKNGILVIKRVNDPYFCN